MSEIEEGTRVQIQFSKRGGVLPVVVQEYKTNEVLMLGYANKEAFNKTITSKKATFWSTSRNMIWTKGETSGDFLTIKEIRIDCDQDAILYIVKLEGKGVCHTKNKAGETRKKCFYRRLDLEKLQLTFD